MTNTKQDARLRALEGRQTGPYVPPTIIHHIIEPDRTCRKILIIAPSGEAYREALADLPEDEQAMAERFV